MKHHIAVFIVVPLLAILAEQNLLKNGSFESFPAGEPAGWTTNNIPTMVTVVSASQNSYAGKTSVKCEVKEFYETKMAGMISQRDIEVKSGELVLKGAYLLKSVGKDVGYVAVDVKSAANSTIATCERYFTESGSDFIPFTISARLPENAKRIDILLTLMAEKGAGPAHVGSYILYDALDLRIVGKETEEVP